jgi:hypothetical protein
MYLKFTGLIGRWMLLAPTVLALGCRGESAVPPPAPAEDLRVEHPKMKKGSDEKARYVGGVLGRLRPGMPRRDVEALIGEPDVEPRERNYGGYANPKCYTVEYYAYLKPKPGDRFAEGVHIMSVMYETVAGEDRFVKVDGPHFPDD